MTNDVSAATVRSPASQPLVEVLARKPSQRAQPSVTPPAAALNLAMQVGDCLLSAGISAKNVVVAMLGIADAYGLCPIVGARLQTLPPVSMARNSLRLRAVPNDLQEGLILLSDLEPWRGCRSAGG